MMIRRITTMTIMLGVFVEDGGDVGGFLDSHQNQQHEQYQNCPRCHRHFPAVPAIVVTLMQSQSWHCIGYHIKRPDSPAQCEQLLLQIMQDGRVLYTRHGSSGFKTDEVDLGRFLLCCSVPLPARLMRRPVERHDRLGPWAGVCGAGC